MKNKINLLAFVTGVLYGLWLLPQLLGTIFVIGQNDTFLGVLGILAYGLVPIPASLIALRWRKLAASCFVASALLWTVGNIDNYRYLEKTFGRTWDLAFSVGASVRVSAIMLSFATFYAVTEWRGWPRLRIFRTPGIPPSLRPKQS